MNDILKELLEQEEELQFHRFNEEKAWDLGNLLFKISRTENLPVTIDITCSGHQLFYVSRPSTSADNDEWVKRKVRLVNRMGAQYVLFGAVAKKQGQKHRESLFAA